MSEFVEAEAQQSVRLESMGQFIEDILEDLEQLDESRLAGLGVTLNKWRRQKE